jgi:hypothetical protein
LRLTLPRPSHPVPNVRDDRETPLLVGGTLESIKLFLPNREAKYFLCEGWTGISRDCPSGKSRLAYDLARDVASSAPSDAKVGYAAH